MENVYAFVTIFFLIQSKIAQNVNTIEFEIPSTLLCYFISANSVAMIRRKS